MLKMLKRHNIQRISQHSIEENGEGVLNSFSLNQNVKNSDQLHHFEEWEHLLFTVLPHLEQKVQDLYISNYIAEKNLAYPEKQDLLQSYRNYKAMVHKAYLSLKYDASQLKTDSSQDYQTNSKEFSEIGLYTGADLNKLGENDIGLVYELSKEETQRFFPTMKLDKMMYKDKIITPEYHLYYGEYYKNFIRKFSLLNKVIPGFMIREEMLFIDSYFKTLKPRSERLKLISNLKRELISYEKIHGSSYDHLYSKYTNKLNVDDDVTSKKSYTQIHLDFYAQLDQNQKSIVDNCMHMYDTNFQQYQLDYVVQNFCFYDLIRQEVKTLFYEVLDSKEIREDTANYETLAFMLNNPKLLDVIVEKLTYQGDLKKVDYFDPMERKDMDDTHKGRRLERKPMKKLRLARNRSTKEAFSNLEGDAYKSFTHDWIKSFNQEVVQEVNDNYKLVNDKQPLYIMTLDNTQKKLFIRETLKQMDNIISENGCDDNLKIEDFFKIYTYSNNTYIDFNSELYPLIERSPFKTHNFEDEYNKTYFNVPKWYEMKEYQGLVNELQAAVGNKLWSAEERKSDIAGANSTLLLYGMKGSGRSSIVNVAHMLALEQGHIVLGFPTVSRITEFDKTVERHYSGLYITKYAAQNYLHMFLHWNESKFKQIKFNVGDRNYSDLYSKYKSPNIKAVNKNPHKFGKFDKAGNTREWILQQDYQPQHLKDCQLKTDYFDDRKTEFDFFDYYLDDYVHEVPATLFDLIQIGIKDVELATMVLFELTDFLCNSNAAEAQEQPTVVLVDEYNFLFANSFHGDILYNFQPHNMFVPPYDFSLGRLLTDLVPRNGFKLAAVSDRKWLQTSVEHPHDLKMYSTNGLKVDSLRLDEVRAYLQYLSKYKDIETDEYEVQALWMATQGNFQSVIEDTMHGFDYKLDKRGIHSFKEFQAKYEEQVDLLMKNDVDTKDNL